MHIKIKKLLDFQRQQKQAAMLESKAAFLLCTSNMLLRLYFLFSVLLFPLSVHSEQLTGRVVAIADGDTLTILDESRKQIKIRLAEIDTPESRQPYGNKAKQELSALAFGKTAIVKVQDIDRYRRIVGRVYVDGVDVNAELVRRGAAWVYPQYVRDRSLFDLEYEARTNKRGLWKLPESERVPPWEWRKAKRIKKAAKLNFFPPEIISYKSYAVCSHNHYIIEFPAVVI